MADNKKEQERAELHRTIWSIANDLRGSVDGWDFKQYVLGTLFYRFISENFSSYIESGDESVNYAELPDDIITTEIKDDAIKTKGYFIYPSQLFVNIAKTANTNESLNTDLAAIYSAIESSANGYPSESDIKGLFADFDTTSNRLGNTVNDKNSRLASVIKGVAGLDFGEFEENQIDLFGDAYEFLISNYAANAGKSGGEFFTPQSVSKLIARLAIHKQTSINKIYDPAAGSGSLLLQAKKQFDAHIIEDGFYGQEINHTTYNLARMNMFLHNINYDKFDIALGNTLLDPQFGDDKPFDAIVSNPPYSINWIGSDDPTLINDERFAPAGVLAPKSKADFAFVLHTLSYLSSKGRAAIVCFPGIFYRGGAEQKIRKYLIDNNFVETVISLAPNLFFGTSIAVPDAEFETVVLKPSEFQQSFIETLSVRADRVRKNMVEPNEDNMLKITNDGRKLALDQRLMDDNLPDFEGNKTTACVNKVFQLWEDSKSEKLTQLIFCDISTPHFDGKFNVYDDMKQKLLNQGVPANEIQFIHSAKTDKQKDDLFAKVRSGDVRVLIGSTQKMGAGTNVQDKLIAIHDLDCPWRPSDLEQRMGRIVRRGNQNEKVYIFRYVTENTFDSYLYQLVENKQKFIGQIMTSKSPVRSAEDIDEATLSYAEIKALATGNPMIKEKMDLEVAVSRLKVLKSAYLNNKYSLEDAVIKKYPENIKLTEEKIQKIKEDIGTVKEHQTKEFKSILINNVVYDEKDAAGNAILNCMKKQHGSEKVKIGKYKGFEMALTYDSWDTAWEIILKGELSYRVKIGTDVFGNITRLDNAIAAIPKQLEKLEEERSNYTKQLETAKSELNKPFQQEQEFKEKTERLAELDILLNLDENDKELEDVVETEDITTLNQEPKVFDMEKFKNKINSDFKLER